MSHYARVKIANSSCRCGIGAVHKLWQGGWPGIRYGGAFGSDRWLHFLHQVESWEADSTQQTPPISPRSITRDSSIDRATWAQTTITYSDPMELTIPQFSIVGTAPNMLNRPEGAYEWVRPSTGSSVPYELVSYIPGSGLSITLIDRGFNLRAGALGGQSFSGQYRRSWTDYYSRARLREHIIESLSGSPLECAYSDCQLTEEGLNYASQVRASYLRFIDGYSVSPGAGTGAEAQKWVHFVEGRHRLAHYDAAGNFVSCENIHVTCAAAAVIPFPDDGGQVFLYQNQSCPP